MGLAAVTSRTFFYHQSRFLIPTILIHWESYQKSLIETLGSVSQAVWCGDGQFNSMGHSAKYGAYTMFCTTILKIVHFDLMQVGFETGLTLCNIFTKKLLKNEKGVVKMYMANEANV